jgi:hypothetical protein
LLFFIHSHKMPNPSYSLCSLMPYGCHSAHTIDTVQTSFALLSRN